MIEVRGLRFAYPGRDVVLDGIDVSIRPGERIALIGLNGSGKSTLLHCLSGLLPCGPGRVLIDGRDPSRDADRSVALATTGLLFETPDEQFVAPTVEREIAFVLESRCLPRRDIRARVDQAMRRFDLERLARRDPGTLSGGEKQRVALAAVLAGDPAYVLLDDPGARLDGSGRALFDGWLRDADPRPAVVEATLRREAAATAETVWTMAGGRLTPGTRPPLGQSPWREVLFDEADGGPHAPARGGESLLEARGLGVTWPGEAGAPLFEGLDVVVAAGEVLAVVGPAGSGKTTLLRILGRLITPASGEVGPRGEARPGGRVAYVPQFAEAQLFAPTVTEDVAFAPLRAGASRPAAIERAVEALGLVGLDPESHGRAFPLDLSQGERRRAVLAGVLAAKPDVLLLDEPETGLDPPGRGLLLGILAALLARGAGLCVATHQPGWLSGLPGRTLMIGGPVGSDGTQAARNLTHDGRCAILRRG